MMSYVDYDNIGVLKIKCMNCGQVIAERSYINLMVNAIPPRNEKVLVLKKLTSFRRKRFNTEGGSYIEAMVCSNCVDLKMNPTKMEKSIRDGWITTWQAEGKTQEEIAKLKKDLPKLEKDK